MPWVLAVAGLALYFLANARVGMLERREQYVGEPQRLSLTAREGCFYVVTCRRRFNEAVDLANRDTLISCLTNSQLRSRPVGLRPSIEHRSNASNRRSELLPELLPT